MFTLLEVIEVVKDFKVFKFLCFGNEASRTRSVCLPIATTFKKVPKLHKRKCYDVIIIGYR